MFWMLFLTLLVEQREADELLCSFGLMEGWGAFERVKMANQLPG